MDDHSGTFNCDRNYSVKEKFCMSIPVDLQNTWIADNSKSWQKQMCTVFRELLVFSHYVASMCTLPRFFWSNKHFPLFFASKLKRECFSLKLILIFFLNLIVQLVLKLKHKILSRRFSWNDFIQQILKVVCVLFRDKVSKCIYRGLHEYFIELILSCKVRDY